MRENGVRFSIASHAAWAPGVDTPDAWKEWAKAPFPFVGDAEPAVAAMPPMLRRRAGSLGKMALEVAYQCLDGRTNIPTVFCSRHGEVTRAIDLLTELVQEQSVSPTGFGLAVHNASAGLFSIARKDQANHIALAAGDSTIEHAVIEACGLLADGEPMVLLVAYDQPLPDLMKQFQDADEQPYAWAWLMVPAQDDVIRLRCESVTDRQEDNMDAEVLATALATAGAMTMTSGLQAWRFVCGAQTKLIRQAGNRRWIWSRDV
ncbi:beta-ketoacyl synthase chain length factor [Undibacterium sp. Ji49W]|uniref:beta-ketoacyl synthase chain length factor n=1 Tax=Undibacterium sp. Ji49W TaxID=3413040 RepID=UPI003BF36C75